jgi:hypothetical protein
MKAIGRRLPQGRFIIVALAFAVALGVVWSTQGFSSAAISTTQKQYSLGQTMVVNGTGFSPQVLITLSVARPDKQTDYISGVTSDTTGSFTASYTPPPDLPGRYTFTATDGANTANTASTSADAIGYNKGVYNKGSIAPDDTTGSWTTGNAGSHYLENQWAYYQYEITGVGSTIPSFDVTFNHYQTNTNAVFVDAFANFRACVDCTDGTVTSGNGAGMLDNAHPYPPNNTTNWKIANSAISLINHPFTSAGVCSPTPDPQNSPSPDHCFHVDGAALRSLLGGDGVFNNGTHTITIFYAAHLAASFVWTQGNEALLGCAASINYVHPFPAAMPDPTAYGTDAYNPNPDPCDNTGQAWTAQFKGVGSATGSSRHFSLTNQSLGSQGSIDLPIPTVAAPSNHIVITKVTNPSAATGVQFGFTGSLGNFNLDTDPGTNTPNTLTFDNIAGGVTYSVTENATTGWNLTGLTCSVTSGTDTGGTITANPGTATASITLGPTDSGVTVTCTYTNTGVAHLIVIKHVVNDNGGTKTAADFTMTINGVTATGGNSFAGAESPGVNKTITTFGSYTVTEGAVAGYSQTGASADCSGTINPGDTKTCTITNDDIAPALHLRKVVVNDNGGTATVADFTLSAAGPTPLSGTSPVDSGATFSAGTYALSETPSAAANGKYTASAWVCVGGTQNGSNITVGLGESATCTITNDDIAPALHLRKVVVNDNGGVATVADFTLSAAGPTPLSGTSPVDSGAGFSAGTYTLSETPDLIAAGKYTASGWVCVGGTQNGSTITLALAQSATCTITNNDIAPALHLRKVVVNGASGTATVADFTLTATGPTSISGTSPVDSGAGFSVGTYALSETPSAAAAGKYSASAWVCVGGTQNGVNITLQNAENATCTITNTALPIVTLQKSINGIAGTTFYFDTTSPGGSGIPATVTATPVTNNGTAASPDVDHKVVPIGNYTFTENLINPGTPGWLLTNISCTGVSNAGSLTYSATGAAFTASLGDNIVCTFTNDQQGGATRTQGFWATHTWLTNAIWAGLPLPPGTSTIPASKVAGTADAKMCGPSELSIGTPLVPPYPAPPFTQPGTNDVLGGFWANIANKSSSAPGNKKRSSLDQARMQMLQQYLAAVLNEHAFGTPGPDLAAARADFCGTDEGKIQNWVGVLGAYNSQGDTQTFDPGSSATAQESKREANIPLWDNPGNVKQ